MLMELFFKIYFTKKKRLMRLAKVARDAYKQKEIDIINQWQQHPARAPVDVDNVEDY